MCRRICLWCTTASPAKPAELINQQAQLCSIEVGSVQCDSRKHDENRWSIADDIVRQRTKGKRKRNFHLSKILSLFSDLLITEFCDNGWTDRVIITNEVDASVELIGAGATAPASAYVAWMAAYRSSRRPFVDADKHRNPIFENSQDDIKIKLVKWPMTELT